MKLKLTSLINVYISELAVSTKKDLLIFQDPPAANHEATEPNRLKFPEQILAIGSDFNQDVYVVTQSDSFVLSNFTAKNATNLNFTSVSGIVDVLPDVQNSRLFVANESHIFTWTSNELQDFYQGEKITSLSYDTCSNTLLFVDRQKIYANSTALPDVFGAQLVTSHSGNSVFTAKNPDLSHSDGFLLKFLDLTLICQSNPEKAFNIRSIELGSESDLFLADAHNLVVWRLDLLEQLIGGICDLKVWTRLTSQPNQMAILNSPQNCIYTKGNLTRLK